MSSSSSTLRPGRRVLRGTGGDAAAPTSLLQLDLAPHGLSRLDPARIDAAVEQGWAAGFDAGLAAGRAAGLAEVEAEHATVTAAHRARLTEILRAAEEAVAASLDDLGDAALAAARATADAAFAVAEAVVGRELATAVHPGRDAVARALALTPDDVEVTLHLHPDDAARGITDGISHGRALRVVADPNVAPGDCIAQAGWTRVDASIEAALARVRAVLEEGS